MSGAAQLLGGGQAGGAGADDRDLFAAQFIRRLGLNPAFFPATLDDSFFDLLDRYGRLVDAENAGGFAGRRADAAGELRKVVGGMQTTYRLVPASAVDEVIPVGNMLLTGQPVWQKGTPHSMQRAPCCCSAVRGKSW